MDEHLRYWQRRAEMGDVEAASRVLTIRIRSEDLNPQWVLIASYLGDPASQRLFPGMELEDINPNRQNESGFSRNIVYNEERLLPQSTPQNPIIISPEARDPRVNNALSSLYLHMDFLCHMCASYIERHLALWYQAYDSPLIARAIDSARGKSQFDLMRLVGDLGLAEDPYNPAAMDIVDAARNLAYLAINRVEIERDARVLNLPVSAVFVKRATENAEINTLVQQISFLTLFSPEDVEWQRQQLISRLLA